ncbi:hypothetical protein [Anaerosporobacter sp.]
MSKAQVAFLVTIVLGIMGLITGLLLGLSSDVGVIFAIATMGAFIISELKSLSKK